MKMDVRQYFDMCKRYWMSTGDSEGVATSKAFWWDCIEVWNADDSWNEEKEKFALEFRNYHKGDPIPEESLIEKGGC